MSDRGVVVVRVEVVGEVLRPRATLLGEEVEHVRDRRVELGGPRVDLGAVAGGEQHDLGEVLARRRGRAAPWPVREAGTAIRSSSSTGTVRWFRPTTIRDTSGATPWLRPRGRHGSGRGCRNRGHAANRRPRSNARWPADASRASESSSSSCLVLGSDLGRDVVRQERGERRGCGRSVPMVTTRSPWRTTDMSVNEQFAGSSAELTQTRRASPASKTDRSTSGVAGGGRRRARRRRGRRGRSAAPRHVTRARRPPSRGPRSHGSGAMTCTAASAPEQAVDLAGGDPARADDDAPPPGDDEVHRDSPASRPATGAGSTARRRRLGVIRLTSRRPVLDPAVRLVEGQDLQLDGEVDLAQRHARREP